MKEEKIQESVRKVDLSGLPTCKDTGKLGKGIDWTESILYEVPFVFDDMEGIIKIEDYDKENQRLTIRYEENITDIHVANFKTAKISSVLGRGRTGFKYKKDDIITIYKKMKDKHSNIKILELFKKELQIRDKMINRMFYRYICLEDGYIGEISQSHLIEGNGCPVCSGKIVIEGINDIATIYPNLENLFLNKSDAKSNGIGSNKKVSLVCPNCNKNKKMTIVDLIRLGKVTCDYCDDGISYPEKFIANILEQNDIIYVKEKMFKWSNKKRYDFYIKDIDCLIEVHGCQHYNGSFSRIGGRSLEEEIKNDIKKRELALLNGIKNYIVIDARLSEKEFMIQSVIKSGILELLEIKKTNWEQCNIESCKSDIKRCWDLWNDKTKDIDEISKILHISRGTIIKYLKLGNESGICDYITRCENSDDMVQRVSGIWKNQTKNIKKISEMLKLENNMVILYLNKAEKRGLCDYSKVRKNRIKVVKNNKTIGYYKSAKEIAIKSKEELGVNLLQDLILDVCNGKRLDYKGYIFIDRMGESA